MSIDLSIDYASDMAAHAHTQFQIYMLQNLPNMTNEQAQKSFVQELYDSSVNGYVIKTTTKPRARSSGGAAHSLPPHPSTHVIGINSIGNAGILNHKQGETCKCITVKSLDARHERFAWPFNLVARFAHLCMFV